jgi:acyl-[acyl carrier protein]--UDP-N-acetylglucosamine O-acyltransferase
VSTVHPTAVIDSRQVGRDVVVDAYCVVDPRAVLHDGVHLHPHVVVMGPVVVGPGTEVFAGAVLGKPPAAHGVLMHVPVRGGSVAIGHACSIGVHAVLYEDVVVGDGSLVGDLASLREGARVGEGCVIGRSVSFHPGVRIGDRSRVLDHTHVATRTVIGEDCFIGVHVVTSSDNALGRLPYDAERVRGPRIDDRAIVGSGANLLPGVHVGAGSLVGAGAIVTRDVEPGATVYGSAAHAIDPTRG